MMGHNDSSQLWWDTMTVVSYMDKYTSKFSNFFPDPLQSFPNSAEVGEAPDKLISFKLPFQSTYINKRDIFSNTNKQTVKKFFIFWFQRRNLGCQLVCSCFHFSLNFTMVHSYRSMCLLRLTNQRAGKVCMGPGRVCVGIGWPNRQMGECVRYQANQSELIISPCKGIKDG